MFIHTETHLFDHYTEKVIKITNNTDDVLNNIELSLSPIASTLIKCKVTRERGSLEIPLPQNLLELGNLYPNESANIYCHLPTSDEYNSPITLEDLELSYTLINSESTIKSFNFNLKDLKNEQS